MPFLFSLIVLGLMVFTLVDIIRRDDSQVKYLPKLAWLFIVILIPLIGSALWFTLGREYPEREIRMPRPSARQAPAPTMPRPQTRSTEQQLADLEKEIEEDRLRAEIARRKRDSDA